jgi:hypothetical protein
MIFYVKIMPLQATNSMEHSPSREASKSSASKEILRILCNQKVHCGIRKRPSPVPFPQPVYSSPCLTFPLL